MPLHVALCEEQGRLDLTFDGNLDFSITREIFAVRQRVNAELVSCVMNLTNVERVFDSGVALVQILCNRCSELGVRVEIKTDQRDLAARLQMASQPCEQQRFCAEY